MAGDVTPANLTNAHHRELLRIDYRSLGIEIDFSGSEIAGSLWRIFEISLYSGDGG